MTEQEQEEAAEAHQEACDEAERLHEFVPRHERGGTRGKSAEYKAWKVAAKRARQARATLKQAF